MASKSKSTACGPPSDARSACGVRPAGELMCAARRMSFRRTISVSTSLRKARALRRLRGAPQVLEQGRRHGAVAVDHRAVEMQRLGDPRQHLAGDVVGAFADAIGRLGPQFRQVTRPSARPGRGFRARAAAVAAQSLALDAARGDVAQRVVDQARERAHRGPCAASRSSTSGKSWRRRLRSRYGASSAGRSPAPSTAARSCSGRLPVR
jgi:hypothetical protein